MIDRTAELVATGRLARWAAWARRALRPPALAARHPVASGFVAVCLILTLALAGLVGSSVVLHPRRGIVGANPADDFQIMTWAMKWWPWAVGHGVDPFTAHVLWAPGGFPTTWVTAIPAPALIALPLTLALGPLFAFNALMFVAVALAGGCAYLLCRELADRTAPAVVGGLMFGLSPYMVGHTLSQHLNLTFVWPVPLVAWAIVRKVRGRWTNSRSFVLVLALLLLLQLGTSLEMFVDLAIVLVLAFAVALAGASAIRRQILAAGTLVALAYAVVSPVLGAVAYLALSVPHGAIAYPPSDYSVDLLNVLVPTPLTLIGSGHGVRSLTDHFVGNLGEQDGYVGLPAVAVVVLAARARWRQGGRFAVLLLIVLLALSLGPFLTLRGRPVIGLPYSAARAPLLEDILPSRLSLFTMLLVACLTAVWLSLARNRVLRVGAAAVVLASLLPNFMLSGHVSGAWAVSDVARFSTDRAPAGFVDAHGWARLVRRGENVLVLPAGGRTAAMYWQAKEGMRFALAVPGTPFVPPALYTQPVVIGLVDDNLAATDGARLAAARLRAFLAEDHVGAVVVTPAATRTWEHVVAVATHAAPRLLAGAMLYPVATHLPSLSATGERVTAGRLTAWLQHAGRRARVEVRIGSSAAMTLSAPDGDAEQTAADARHGHAVVVFTESHPGRVLLRVATRDPDGGWRVSTLDRRSQPIWSLRARVAPDGSAVVTWIDQADPLRLVRASVRPPHARWEKPVTLDDADGLGAVEAAATDRTVLLAWRDSLANEQRVRVATHASGRWTPTATVGWAVPHLAGPRIVGPGASLVEWLVNGQTHTWHREETG